MSPGLLQDNGLQLVLVDHARHGFVRFCSPQRVDQAVDRPIHVNAQVETSPRGKTSVRIKPGLNRFGCFGIPEMHHQTIRRLALVVKITGVNSSSDRKEGGEEEWEVDG